MHNYLRPKFNNLPLFQKIFLLFLILFLWLNIFFFISIQVFMHRYDETLYQSTAETLSYITDSIETEMNEIVNLSSYIVIDSTIQSNLEHLKENPTDIRASSIRRDIYNAFYSYFDTNPYISSISVVTEDSVICMGADITEQAFNQEKIRQSALDAQGRPLWIPGDEGNVIACVREVRRLSFLKLDDIGILYIVLDLNQLVQDALHQFQNANANQTFILLNGDKRFYPSYDYYDSFSSLVMDSILEKQHGYLIDSLNGKKVFAVYGSLSTTNWNYIYIQDYNQLFLSIQVLRWLLMISVLFSAVLTLGITRLLLKNTFRHLDYLIEKIHHFGKGIPLTETNNYDYSNREDEIGQLHRTFDEMTHSVKVLRDENYDKQLLLRDARIRILEQQINPHFLYNTLDTINWMAQAYGADDISIMVRSLGNLFRASIAADKDCIPLEKELDFLNNYIQIQKIRFKERLDFMISVPDDISSIEIPKLCIQPLVENAMKYAMECSDETCTIQVTITEESEQYRIQVANTGSSFEENLLEKLEQHSIQPQGTGVGLININSRLQLLYGEQYGLHIRNEDGMAIVILSIPKQKKDDNRRIK